MALRWMKSSLIVFGVSSGLAGSTLAAPALPVKLSKAAADAVLQEIAKDRADTQNWLKSDPMSYLATVDRRDFEQRKTLTVGRAADNDVRIEDPVLAPHHLRVTVDGDRFRVEAVDASARFKAGKEEVRNAVLDPSSIHVGRYLLRLSHQRFPAIIVFDPQSPRCREYRGLKYFPADLSYRYELALTPNAKPVGSPGTELEFAL